MFMFIMEKFTYDGSRRGGDVILIRANAVIDISNIQF